MPILVSVVIAVTHHGAVILSSNRHNLVARKRLGQLFYDCQSRYACYTGTRTANGVLFLVQRKADGCQVLANTDAKQLAARRTSRGAGCSIESGGSAQGRGAADRRQSALDSNLCKHGVGVRGERGEVQRRNEAAYTRVTIVWLGFRLLSAVVAGTRVLSHREPRETHPNV
jgi:hypothetical protein